MQHFPQSRTCVRIRWRGDEVLAAMMKIRAAPDGKSLDSAALGAASRRLRLSESAKVEQVQAKAFLTSTKERSS